MKRLERILLTVGIILIILAAILTIYNIWDSNRAGRASDEIAEKLEKRISSEASGDASPENKETIKIDGREYIGILKVPSLGLELPVEKDWSYRNLRLSPCRYSGSYDTNDLVICGHNYARHFSPLKTIAIGTDIYLETVKGQNIHYKVTDRKTVQPTDIEEMIGTSDTEDWDMTLFTCNTGGQTRCAVRCRRAE